MNFIPQFEPLVLSSYSAAVSNQIISGWIGCSDMVNKFENRICELFHHDYCISTTSGTTALIMAIKSLELPSGSTILFPNYTFLAGANAARFLGYNVRLVDIKEDTLCMDHTKMNISPDVSCIIFVNNNAYVGPDVQIIKESCDANKIPMIEDSAQAIGMNNAGRTGDIGIYSFSVPKLVTTGQGGAVVTNNKDLATKCCRLRDHGDNWRKSKHHSYLGVNFKFNDILASYGMAQLEHFNDLLTLRDAMFSEYRKYIKIIDFGYLSTWMVIYKSKYVSTIINSLADKNIQAVQYYHPINWNDPYRTEKSFEVSEEVYNTHVYLPSSLTLSDEQIKDICETIKRVENNE